MRCKKMQINAKKMQKNATPQPMHMRSNSTTAFPQQWMLKILPSHYHTGLNLPSISPLNMSIFVFVCWCGFGPIIQFHLFLFRFVRFFQIRFIVALTIRQLRGIVNISSSIICNTTSHKFVHGL